MKTVFLCLLLFASSTVFAQNLILRGHVISYENVQNGNIYYSINDKGFNKQLFITYNKTTGYGFKISLAKIAKEKIKTLNFSADASQDPGSMNACVHKIRVDEILKDTAFINKKNIELTTDLSPDTYCEETILSTASKDGNGRFIGEYNFTLNGNRHLVRLMNDFYEYSASINFQYQKLYREETGYWEYNKEKNLLTLHIQYLQNQKLGLLLFDNANYEFTVTEQAGKLQFIGNNGTLTKD